MHRLSKISASILGRKSEPDTLNHVLTSSNLNESGSKTGNSDLPHLEAEELPLANKPNSVIFKLESFERPTSLHLPSNSDGLNTDKKTEDEWFETAALSPARMGLSAVFDNACAYQNDGRTQIRNQDAYLPPILCSESAAEIDVMEQSLVSLLDDFRSGRMKALSEGRLEQMRNARREMEELSMAHIKLHRLQLSGASSSTSAVSMDDEYDALFKKVDNFYESMQKMSFNSPSQLNDNL